MGDHDDESDEDAEIQDVFGSYSSAKQAKNQLGSPASTAADGNMDSGVHAAAVGVGEPTGEEAQNAAAQLIQRPEYTQLTGREEEKLALERALLGSSIFQGDAPHIQLTASTAEDLHKEAADIRSYETSKMSSDEFFRMQLALAKAESLKDWTGNDENSKRLEERVNSFNLKTEDVDDGGHCQFDALLRQIKRFPRDYDTYIGDGKVYDFWGVRKDIAQWLRDNENHVLQNGDTISRFRENTDGATWAEFCNNVEDKDTKVNPLWGNYLTLIAAANLYKRPIHVWTSCDGDRWWTEINPMNTAEAHTGDPFKLGHLYERHYLSIIAGPRCGPGIARGGSRRQETAGQRGTARDFWERSC